VVIQKAQVPAAYGYGAARPGNCLSRLGRVGGTAAQPFRRAYKSS